MSSTGDERRYFVYVMASKPWGTLYVGMTGDLQSPVYQHRKGLIPGFTKTYSTKALVYFQEHENAASAIHREKRLKKWPRAWKINLIRTDNPDWKDLAADWYPPDLTPERIENWVARIAQEGATGR